MKILGHKIVKIALFSIKITNCLHISFFFTNFAAHFVIEALTLRLHHEKLGLGEAFLNSVSRRYLVGISWRSLRRFFDRASRTHRDSIASCPTIYILFIIYIPLILK